MFAWIMNRPVNFFGPVFGLPMVGLGSLAVQRSIGGTDYSVATLQDRRFIGGHDEKGTNRLGKQSVGMSPWGRSVPYPILGGR